MILWALACRPSDTDVAVETDDTDVHEHGEAFVEPPVATDLDPDPAILHVALVMAPTDDGALAYNGSVPGPTLRLQTGDTVIADITNGLTEDTTLHWHGLTVPWAVDGVMWMQDPIRPGETRTVTFVVDTPGTFWYHPHFDSGLGQVGRGLYGVVVVEDPADPPVDVDTVWVFDQGTEMTHDAHEQHRAPWRLNGVDHPTWALEAGQVVRARVVNPTEGGYLDLRSTDATWIAGDQGLFSSQRLPGEGLILGPGDRAELVYTVGDDFEVVAEPYTMHGGAAWGAPQTVLTVDTPAPGSVPSLPPFAFDGAAPSPDASSDITWVFSGDDEAWFMNGEQFPDVTIPELAFGDIAVIEVRNLSPTEHPFHLHGMPFEVLSIDGVPPEFQDWEDTVNVPIRGVLRVRVTASNAGDWMAHCHILSHAHGGMMSILRVHPPE